MEELDEAGGVYAVMNELSKKGLLHEDCITVTGKTVGENIADCPNLDPSVIRPVDEPYSETGGIAVLRGNLAPDGCVVKRAAVAAEMLVHEGPARVFECEQDAQEAINAGRINPGDVVVIRYEGPKGGPGMREMLNPTSAIMGMGLGTSVALITDGRFSGALPEMRASATCRPRPRGGGPIGVVQEGDIISIDIPACKLELKVSDEELAERLAAFEPKTKELSGYLKRYAALVSSNCQGTNAELGGKSPLAAFCGGAHVPRSTLRLRTPLLATIVVSSAGGKSALVAFRRCSRTSSTLHTCAPCEGGFVLEEVANRRSPRFAGGWEPCGTKRELCKRLAPFSGEGAVASRTQV